MTPEQRFDLFGERYAHLEDVMADAQRAQSTGVWNWGSKGIGPVAVMPGQRGSMPGANNQNSYYLNVGKIIQPAGARGERRDTETMVAYFTSQGWPVSVHQNQLGNWVVRAETDEGYYFTYTVRPNGSYSLELSSPAYWGDQSELLNAVIGRIPEATFEIEESLPGVHIPFPKWSDPILW